LRFHRERDALITACLTRVPDPLDFGITILDEAGRIQRFWRSRRGARCSRTTVSTGIYVVEPEVFDYIPAGEKVDWSEDSSRRC